MKKIAVRLNYYLNNSYQILVEPDLVNRLPKILKKSHYGQKYCIITDNAVKKIHGDELLKFLKKEGLEAEIIALNGGENAKSFDTVIKIGEQMLSLGFTRQDCIIALGGGIVGDVAGFLASIYMRGIPYVQIPTSLMAMVDSAIGGKTGVNSPQGKNLFGTIHQPEAVYVDSLFLETAPLSEIRNGMAEVIKYGVSLNKKLFKFLEKHLEKIYKPPAKSPYKLHHHILNKIILQSIKIKARIVEKDEKENSFRMVLNYGHTFGHAIEKQSQFHIPHGNAISIGMCLANEKAVKEGLLKAKKAERIKKLFLRAGLPTELPKTIKKPDLKKFMLRDKKNLSKNHIRYVLVRDIGKVYITK